MRDATTLVHLEALLVSLRDQLDHLTERVDARLADQELQLKRLRRELSRLKGASTPGPIVQRSARPVTARQREHEAAPLECHQLREPRVDEQLDGEDLQRVHREPARQVR
jgi:hypothetical protein